MGALHLDTWSGMQVFAASRRDRRSGRFPRRAELGRRLSRIDPGRLRSLFTGQANVVLLRCATRGSRRASSC